MTESKQTYTEPVSRLLGLGDVSGETGWRDYLALGLTQQDAPELSRMILDRELTFAGAESDEVWAPVHAWRALAQLEAKSALPALIELLNRVEEYDDDWTSEELPVVFAHLGEAALEPLTTFLADSTQGMWSRATAATGLVKLAERHPALRAEAVAALDRQLANFEQQDATFNGLLIGDLIDLKGVEAAPTIERAFAAKKVNLSLQGDWEEVQIYLGLLDKRSTPSPNYRALMKEEMGFDPQPLLDAIEQRVQADPELTQLKTQRQATDKAKSKTKARRKQAKQSRKKQRKRK